MRIIESVPVSVVQEHEKQVGANVRLGGYHMNLIFPPEEFETSIAVLDDNDLNRLFLLGNFAHLTKGRTCKVKNIVLSSGTSTIEKVEGIISQGAHLGLASQPEIVMVTVDAQRGPWVITDANHRTISWFLTHASIHGVLAYVCEHSQINEWGFVPRAARESVNP